MTIKDLLQTKELKIYVTFSLFLYIYKYYDHKNFFINQQISLKLGGNNMKKLVLFLLTSTLLISNISLVFAAETNESNTAANTHQSITIEKNGDFLTDQNKVTRGTSYPSRGWDLSNEDYTGSVQFRNNVITNYYFTGNTDLYVKVNFARDIVYGNTDASVKLYCNGTQVDSKTFYCGTTPVSKSFHFSNLNSKKKYAIEFNKGSSDGSEITGTFRITN